MDVNKVLLDVEHEDEIVEVENRPSQFRYSVINAAVGYVAKVTHKAVNHKPYAGKACYITSAIANFLSSNTDNFDVLLQQPDGTRIELLNEETMLLLIMNGKFGGGRVCMSPMALLNDGLLDITLQHGPATVKEIV